MAVVKSPKNNKRKDLWIRKNTYKLKKKVIAPVRIASKSKQVIKTYKILLNQRNLKNSIKRAIFCESS